jgi:hypothetical protein
MLTVRLDETTEQRLLEACRQLGCSKSEAVKQSTEQACRKPLKSNSVIHCQSPLQAACLF